MPVWIKTERPQKRKGMEIHFTGISRKKQTNKTAHLLCFFRVTKVIFPHCKTNWKLRKSTNTIICKHHSAQMPRCPLRTFRLIYFQSWTYKFTGIYFFSKMHALCTLFCSLFFFHWIYCEHFSTSLNFLLPHHLKWLHSILLYGCAIIGTSFLRNK